MHTELLSTEKAKLFVKILGIIQLTIGLFCIVLAPAEIYSFYLFSEGGRFHYHGFEIGSFLYGLIFAQIIAYYSIGFLFLVAGYGHLKLKSWTLNLAVGSIWFWIIFGLPVIFFFFPLLTMKDINTRYTFMIISIVAIVLIIIIPGFLLLFYKQMSVRELFVNYSQPASGLSNITVRSYLLLIVYCLYILIFHIMIFYEGLFPLFGTFLTGIKGIVAYSLSVLLMILLIYGLVKREFWSWIISICFFSLFALSSLITILNYRYTEIIELLDFPKLENDIFLKLPLKSFYLLMPAAYIFLITILIIIMVKKFFNQVKKQQFNPAG
jgi:hypothetical protein